jgi:hypothetical protein
MEMRPALLRLFTSVALVGSALPAAAADSCGTLKQFASVEMILDDAGRALVPITIDGKSKLMLLDTGGVIQHVDAKGVGRIWPDRTAPRRYRSL